MLVLSGMVWFPGFLLQKTNNVSCKDDYSIPAEGIWVWFLGMRPGKGRVYLRPASVQILALLYLLVGFLAVLFCDTEILRKHPAFFAVCLFCCGMFWLSVDIASRIKR